MPQQPAPAYWEKVYNYIMGQIISQEYRVGDMLNERSIANQLEVSRTPVREAVQKLEVDGWVTVVPWKGIFICGVTQKQVEEVFQIRCSLECLAIQLAIGNVSNQQRIQLYNLLVLQKEKVADGDSQGFIKLDRQFHNAIAECSGNGLLWEMLSKLDNSLLRLGMQSVQDTVRYQKTLEEHKEILLALDGEDTQTAEQAMRYHLEETKTNLLEQLLTRKTAERGDKE